MSAEDQVAFILKNYDDRLVLQLVDIKGIKAATVHKLLEEDMFQGSKFSSASQSVQTII